MRAWLTPDSSLFSNPLDCRTLTIPGDLWLYVQGALEELAKDYNWEQFGDATPEETSQFFMEVLDNFSTSGCGSEGGVGMQSISTSEVEILNVNQTTNPTGIADIYVGDLPAEAQNASALYCRVVILADDYYELYVWDWPNAQQMYDISTYYLTMPLVMPINNGQIRIRLLSAPENYSLSVFLIGWW